MLLQGVYAIPIYLIAKRMRNGAVLPVVLTIIPIFGLFYWVYFMMYKVFKVIFDRLEILELKKSN
jgi:Kef-type K+ transport system membrane component KefB